METDSLPYRWRDNWDTGDEWDQEMANRWIRAPQEAGIVES